MAVVVIGHRRYGRVHAHGGEYADTDFAHVSFIPVFPLASYWVSNEPGNERIGFPIRLHARSVLAAYLRTWGPVVAVGAFLASSLAATAVAAVLAALSAWSWTWRSRRGTRVLQRSDFDRVALGSRCDPAWMAADMREHLARRLQAELAERKDARPPDDVARFGAKDLEEATLAYGLLRLGGVRHPDTRAAADRLLASAFDGDRPSQGAPYREDHGGGARGLGAQVAAAAHVHARATEARLHALRPGWFHNRWLRLGGLVLLTAAAVSVIAERTSPTLLDARVLDAADPPIGEHVSAACDRVEEDAWHLLKNDEVKHRVKLCWIGERFLPVVSSESDPVEGLFIEGELKHGDRPEPRDRSWLAELRGDPQLAAQAYDVFLDGEGEIDRRLAWLIAVVCSIGAVIGWWFWIRGFRRRRADDGSPSGE